MCILQKKYYLIDSSCSFRFSPFLFCFAKFSFLRIEALGTFPSNPALSLVSSESVSSQLSAEWIVPSPTAISSVGCFTGTLCADGNSNHISSPEKVRDFYKCPGIFLNLEGFDTLRERRIGAVSYEIGRPLSVMSAARLTAASGELLSLG